MIFWKYDNHHRLAKNGIWEIAQNSCSDCASADWQTWSTLKPNTWQNTQLLECSICWRMDFEDRAPFQKQESVARLFWCGQPPSDPRFYVNFVCCQSSIGRLWLLKFRRGMARVHISSSFVRLWRAYSNYWVWVAFWKSCWTHLDVSCASCGYWLWIVVWAGSVCANRGIFRNIEDRWCYLDLGLSSSCCIAYLEPETIGQQSLATCFSHVAICSQEVWSGEFGWSRLLQSPMHWDRRISERNVDYCLLYLRQALIGSAHGSF